MSIFKHRPSAGGILAIVVLGGAIVALSSIAGLVAWLIVH